MAEFREIMETDAESTIADIFAEIRLFYAAPYVSSLFRHLATYPGLLEWIWNITRPAFSSGNLQHKAWDLADVSSLVPLPKLSAPVLRCFGVDVKDEELIKVTYQTFIRVSPVNLVFAGCLERILMDEPINYKSVTFGVRKLPECLPRLPEIASPNRLNTSERRILETFQTDLAGEKFVPGLYRILIRWPAYLAHIAVVIGPQLSDPNTILACEQIAIRVSDGAPKILETLKRPTEPPPLTAEEKTQVLSALSTYRGTSPQMLGFGSLLLNSLPS